VSPRIIGLGFEKRSGKDTVADFLVEDFGAIKMAFAGPLKAATKEIFGWDERHVNGDLKEVVDTFWGFTPRWALQKVGTEGIRDVIGRDTWTKRAQQLVERSGADVIVFTDVRFPEEAAFIEGMGGELWHVHRPALHPPRSWFQRVRDLFKRVHSSEKAMRRWDWDRTLINGGSLADLRQLAKRNFTGQA
jgi:hypothetical protein